MNVGGAGRPGFAMAVRANLVRAPALVLKRWDASENTMTSEVAFAAPFRGDPQLRENTLAAGDRAAMNACRPSRLSAIDLLSARGESAFFTDDEAVTRIGCCAQRADRRGSPPVRADRRRRLGLNNDCNVAILIA